MIRRPAERTHRIGRPLAAAGLAVVTALLLGACYSPWTAPDSTVPTPTRDAQSQVPPVSGISGLSGSVTNSGAFKTPEPGRNVPGSNSGASGSGSSGASGG